MFFENENLSTEVMPVDFAVLLPIWGLQNSINQKET